MTLIFVLLLMARIEAMFIDSIVLRFGGDLGKDHLFTHDGPSNILKIESNVRVLNLLITDKDNLSYKPMLADSHENHPNFSRSGVIGERRKKRRVEYAYIRIRNGSMSDSLQSLENSSSVVQFIDSNMFRVSDSHVDELMLLVLDSCRNRLLDVCVDRKCKRRHVSVSLNCSRDVADQQIKTVLEVSNTAIAAATHNKTHDSFKVSVNSSAIVRCTTVSVFMDNILKRIDATFDKSQLTVHLDNVNDQLYTTADQVHTFKIYCLSTSSSIASFKYVFHNDFVHTVELQVNCTKHITVKDDMVTFIKDERDNIIYMSVNHPYDSIVINSAEINSDVAAVFRMPQSHHGTFIIDKDSLAYISYTCTDDKSHWIKTLMLVYGRPLQHSLAVRCNSKQWDRNIYVEIGAAIFIIFIGVAAYIVVVHINGRLHRLKAMKQRQRDKKYLEIVGLQ